MRIERILSVVAVISCLAGLAWAGGVGSMLPIWSDIVDNVEPDAAFSPNHGSFLTVWSTHQDDFTWDIWARPVTTEGAVLPAFSIDAVAGIRLWQPVVAYGTAQDEYLVVYTCRYSDADHDIWAHRTKWNAIGATSRILIDTLGYRQWYPAVAYNSHADEFLVVYESQVDTALTTEVWGARIPAATGAVIGPQAIATSASGVYRGRPDVAYDPVHNRYVIVYGLETTATMAIMVRTASADLSSISPEQQVASGIWVNNPAVAAGPEGVLVAWMLWLSDSGQIFSRRATLGGTPVGPAAGFQIDAGVQYEYLKNVDVAFDAAGGFLVVWDSFLGNTANESDVYGRYMAASWNGATTPAFVIDDRQQFQGEVSVAGTGEGLSLAVLTHDPGPPDPDDEIQGYFVFSPVFADSFEGGDTSAWSSTTG